MIASNWLVHRNCRVMRAQGLVWVGETALRCRSQARVGTLIDRGLMHDQATLGAPHA